jgi:hypothetical protein
MHLRSGRLSSSAQYPPVDFLADFPSEMVSKNKRHDTSWRKRLAREIFAAAYRLRTSD